MLDETVFTKNWFGAEQLHFQRQFSFTFSIFKLLDRDFEHEFQRQIWKPMEFINNFHFSTFPEIFRSSLIKFHFYPLI